MKTLLHLAWHSAMNRRFSLGLMMIVISISSALLLVVDRLRTDARNSFAQSISGTDLIVGARGSSIQLTLYSVFRIGDASNNIQWESYEAVKGHPAVAWSVPLSLGDSHLGFPVVATNGDYFKFLKYGNQRSLVIHQGRAFGDDLDHIFEAVIGAKVAEDLGYRLGDHINLTHGMLGGSHAEHENRPFEIVGILAATGTPVDRSVHISLQAMEAIHLDWQAGAPIPGLHIDPQHVRKFDLAPQEITAALVGLKNRSAVFRVQRSVQSYADEALTAVIPGVALDELWQMLAQFENLLRGITVIVGILSLTSMVAVISSSLNERRRELAILRAVGATPWHIAGLTVLESLMLSLLGLLIGLVLAQVVAATTTQVLQEQFGVSMTLQFLRANEFTLLMSLLAACLLAGVVPAWRAFRLTLRDGLTARI